MGLFNGSGTKGDKPTPTEEELTVEQKSVEVEDKKFELPDLKLREVLKSDKPVNVEDGSEKKIKQLRSWNNYTIVTLEGSKGIFIFDENAKKIEGFERKSILNFDGKKFAEVIGKTSFTNQISQLDHITILLSQLPESLQSEGINILNNYRVAKIGLYFLKGSIKVPNFEVVDGGKYIVFYSDSGDYLAFQTENNSGVILEPKDWTTIDNVSFKERPKELEEFCESIKNSFSGYKPLNEKYTALTTAVGLNIVDSQDKKGKPLFSDTTPSIDKNIVVDPNNSNLVYYCSSNNPKSVFRLDLTEEPGSWKPVEVQFPIKYKSIDNLQLDPTGNFFLFYSDADLVIISKDTLEEVKKIPNMTNVNFDASGNIRAVDKDGYLVVYEPNFVELAQEMDRQRVIGLAEGIDLEDIFEQQSKKKTKDVPDNTEHLDKMKVRFSEKFDDGLSKITTKKGLVQAKNVVQQIAEKLSERGLKAMEIKYVITALEEKIAEKEKEFVTKEAREAVDILKVKLVGSLSISTISEAKAQIEEIKSYETLLEGDLKQEFRALVIEFEQKTKEFFQQRGSEVIKEVHGLISRTRQDLEAYTSKSQMDDWLEFRYPQLKSRLGSLANDVPLEAAEAYNSIIAARTELSKIATEFEVKFKSEYAKVREVAAERRETAIGVLESDIESLIDRLKTRGFQDRTTAEQYLESSDARKVLEEEISTLAGDNPTIAKELNRAFKVRVSNALTEIERAGKTQIAETGQQMILFGNVYFPKWEAKVKEKKKSKYDVVFEEDNKTRGPGVSGRDVLGDVAVKITGAEGQVETLRLYQDWDSENEWRLGLHLYDEKKVGELSNPPSYVSGADFAVISKEYRDWSSSNSKLKKELETRQQDLKEFYKTGDDLVIGSSEEQDYIKERTVRLREYTEFYMKNHILLLKRTDKIKQQTDIEYSNGKGYIPSWQSHWVSDSQTDKNLEDMARAFKMQLDLQEGLLNLKGHAGTGKDVLIKMFCALTHRPYFSVDCTKWTTEYELGEDVTLESKDGASQTIKVPSAVLNGITTPGAVVYFNEFNAMPEQAQIFLHALMDEKRSLTLKTSSSKLVKADPSVLLASSMNPGYPGTFEPQFATKSRMVSLEIGYPSLTKNPDKNDANKNPVYDSSEALRIARGVDSLAELTYEADIQRNGFVKIWDKYINGIDNGAPEPSIVQKFDIDTILALVQFANKLRDDFIKIFEKSRDARNSLQVSQPITGRELRRCAYALSQIPSEEKTKGNTEAVARDLLSTYFLSHIDKKEDKEKIRTAMSTWTSQKRLR